MSGECPECGGKMRLLSVVLPAEAVRDILLCLNLSSEPPPVSPAKIPEEYFF